MNSAPVHAVGMSWYLAEDFAEIKALMEDPQNFHATYSEWLKQAEKREQTELGKGVRVYRALIRPAEFREWCRLHSQKLNAEGRTNYASWVAAQEYAAGR